MSAPPTDQRHHRYLAPDTRLRAVLETSFWVAAHRAEVAANSFDFFAMVVPAAVQEEILATQVGHPFREYPYATLFRQLRHRMIDPPADSPPAISRFGPGEAAAIALAGSLPAILLINEHPDAQYARNLGIPVVTVPSFIVTLRGLDLISDRAARRKLELIGPVTSPRYITEARQFLDYLV